MSIAVTLESGNFVERDGTKEILTYSRLPGLRKVAILFRSVVLEDEAAARALLDSLNSMEQVMVREELDSMGVLAPEMVTDVLKEFGVLCGIHTAYGDRGIDGAISVGEKFLQTAQARRLALALSGEQEDGDLEFETRAEGAGGEGSEEIVEEIPGAAEEEAAEENTGEPDGVNDLRETLVESESLPLPRQEEKDLEDVVS